MSEYTVAPSFRDWETIGTPLVRDGKMYQKVRTKCDRCGGLGLIASRVENGQIIPIPVANGVCFKCGGAKYMYKEVRLYTVEEAEKMEKRNEAARAKREEERQAKMKAEYACNALGMNLTTAINIYLVKLGNEMLIPFKFSADPFYSNENKILKYAYSFNI